MRMLCFCDFITKYIKFKQENKKKHNFKWKYFMVICFSWNNWKWWNEWTVFDVNPEPFRKCFASGIFILNMLKSTVQKLKKHIMQKFLKGNRVFIKQKWSEEASKSEQFTMLIVNHLTNANVLFLDFYYKICQSQTKKS